MAVGKGQSSRLEREVRIERPVADDSLDGAGSGNWALVAKVAAGVVDALPSRSERLADGINVASRPSRVRIRYRAGLDASMRIVIGRTLRDDDDNPVWHTDRVTQIVSGPAEVGRREWTEFMVEDYSTAGNAA